MGHASTEPAQPIQYGFKHGYLPFLFVLVGVDVPMGKDHFQ
jgi:hypothetical protein